MMQGDPQLDQAFKDMGRLVLERSLPPLLEIKLRYLESKIIGKEINEVAFKELPSYQRYSLENLNRATQINLFKSIVSCLSGRQIITYFTNEPAQIRKNDTFSMWTKCYLSCDSERLTARKKSKKEGKPYLQFSFKELRVSKAYKNDKSKHIIGVMHQKTPYLLTFEQETACIRIHQNILQLSREARKKPTQPQKITTELPVSDHDGEIMLDTDTLETYGEQEAFQASKQMKDIDTYRAAEERIMLFQLSNDRNYTLDHNIQCGRVLKSNVDSKIKISLLLEKCSIARAIQAYVKFPEWNAEFSKFKMLNRVGENNFKVYFCCKSYSLLSQPRDAYALLTCFRSCRCVRKSEEVEDIQKVYLTLVNYEAELTSGYTRMKFNQIVEFTENKRKQGLVLVTILTDADFLGYATASDNVNMTLALLKQTSYLPKFCKEQVVGNGSKSLFQIEQCRICESPLPRQIPKMSPPHLIEEPKSNKVIATKEQAMSEENKYKLLHQHLQKYNSGAQCDDLLEFIATKVQERYFLKKKFILDLDPAIRSKDFTLLEDRDFLIQNGNWRFEGDEYIYSNEGVLAAQKDILKYVVKKISSNFFSGQSIMNMSLPVQIFANKSLLELIADTMGFLPRFLHEASLESNLVEQIKFVMIPFMFLGACAANIEKPFNPLLGETFTAKIGGIPIYLQQISHHPPISALLIKTDEFEVSGSFALHVDMGINSIYSKTCSFFNVKMFRTNAIYLIKCPDLQISGLIYGDRKLKAINKGFTLEVNNNIFCEYSVGKDKKKVYESQLKVKPADVLGGIFKTTSAFAHKYKTHDKKKTFQGLKFEDVIEKYSLITGKWYGSIEFDGVSYKAIDNPYPLKIERDTLHLPSDSGFRTDIILKRWNKIEASNAEKEKIENMQRNDRKLREKNEK